MSNVSISVFAREMAALIVDQPDPRKDIIQPSALRAALNPIVLSRIQGRFESFLKEALEGEPFNTAMALSAFAEISTRQQAMAYGFATNDKDLGDKVTSLLESRAPLREIESTEEYMNLIEPLKETISKLYTAQGRFESQLTNAFTPLVLPIAAPSEWKKAFAFFNDEENVASFLSTLTEHHVSFATTEDEKLFKETVVARFKELNDESKGQWAKLMSEQGEVSGSDAAQLALADSSHGVLTLVEIMNRLSEFSPRARGWTNYVRSSQLATQPLFAIEFTEVKRGVTLSSASTRSSFDFGWNKGIELGSLNDSSTTAGLVLHMAAMSGVEFIFTDENDAKFVTPVTVGIPASFHWFWDGVSSLFSKSWRAFDIVHKEQTWIETLKGAALARTPTPIELLRNKLASAIEIDVREFLSEIRSASKTLSVDILRKEVNNRFNDLPRWKSHVITHDSDIAISTATDAATFAKAKSISFETTRPVGSVFLPHGTFSDFSEIVVMRNRYQSGRVMDADTIHVIEGIAKELLKPYACTQWNLTLHAKPEARLFQSCQMLESNSLPADGELRTIHASELVKDAQFKPREDFAVQVVRHKSESIVLPMATGQATLDLTIVSSLGSGIAFGQWKARDVFGVAAVTEAFGVVLHEIFNRIMASAALHPINVEAGSSVGIELHARESSYARRIAAFNDEFVEEKVSVPLVTFMASAEIVPAPLRQLMRGVSFEDLRAAQVFVHSDALQAIKTMSKSTAALLKASQTADTIQLVKSIFVGQLTEKQHQLLHNPYNRSAVAGALQTISEMLTTVKASPALAYIFVNQTMSGI